MNSRALDVLRNIFLESLNWIQFTEVNMGFWWLLIVYVRLYDSTVSSGINFKESCRFLQWNISVLRSKHWCQLLLTAVQSSSDNRIQSLNPALLQLPIFVMQRTARDTVTFRSILWCSWLIKRRKVFKKFLILHPFLRVGHFVNSKYANPTAKFWLTDFNELLNASSFSQ